MFNELLFAIEVFFLFGIALFAVKKGEFALLALLCIQGIFANLFVLKQITLFHFQVTASDSLAVGCVFSLNLFQEFFGKEKAKRASTISLMSLIFCSLLSLFHLGYKPSLLDNSQIHYEKLLAVNPRIALSSLLAFFLSQRADLLVFSFLKKRFSSLSLGIRSALSSTFSQFLDTALFTFLGLYGLVDHLGDILILSFAIKLILIFSLSTLLFFSKKTLQRLSH